MNAAKRFKKGDRLGVLAGLSGASLLIIRHDTIGIDDGCTALALVDIAIQRRAWRNVIQL